MKAEAIPLVVVDDDGLRWAVLAYDVREIVHTALWRGEPLLNVAKLWKAGLQGGLPYSATESLTSRALVVRTAVGERALLSPRVSFRIVDRSTLLSLPDLLAWGRGAAMVTSFVFGESEEPLIVLNPSGFVDRGGTAPAGASRQTDA
jgi:hypothetical protein